MTTKIMQRLAGKVSVLIMVALLIAAVGTYGLSNSKHDSTGRATAAVSPSKVEVAPASAASAQPAAVSVVKDVSVTTRTSTTTVPAPVSSASAAIVPTVSLAPPEVAKAQTTPLANARTSYAKLPLSFIPNQGQFQKGVSYEAHGASYVTSLTEDAAYIGLHRISSTAKPGKQALVRLGFEGANKLRYEPGEKQSSYANYIGGPRSTWLDHVPNYGRVTAGEVYPGIAATFYGNQGHMQFDFIVKPGADPKAIRLKIDGGKTKLDENGDLAIATELGTIYQRKPVLYQEANGVRQPVEGSYKLDGDTVTFDVGAYDASRTLTIDPVLYFSLVVGGGQAGPPAIGDSTLNAVAEDAGAIYVAGTSNSNSLNLSGTTTISGSSQTSNAFNHALIVSFSRSGVVNWYTYVQGNSNDTGLGIAVEDLTTNTTTTGGFPNAQYGIYAVGQTFSSNLAVGDTAANSYKGGGDGWIIRLNGTGFDAATGPVYIGGANGDAATSVAVRCAGGGGCSSHDRQNDVYVGMWVQSLIATPTGLQAQNSFGGGEQAGAIVDLRATDLTAPGSNKGTVVYVSGSQSASVTALALMPFPTASGVLQQATKLAFVGNITGVGTPLSGGLNSITNAVQGGHGGTDNNGYGGGTSDGLWGVLNTELTPNDPSVALSHLFNLDYVGGAGNDNLKAVSVLPDGNLVAVGDTTALPFTTTGPGGVINGSLPPQNTSFGANGTSPTGGSQDVVAVIINPGGIQGAVTANVGATASGSATVGTPATATISDGGVAAIANAAAGVQAAGSAVVGNLATLTITHGTNVQVTVTQGTQATGTLNLIGNTVGSVSFTPGTGYWTVPTVTITGGTCTVQPTAQASLTSLALPTPNGTIAAITVTNGGVCTVAPTGVTIQAPGIQGVAVSTAGAGYQNGASVSIPFNNTGTCATAPTATITANTPAGPNNTNASFTTGALTVGDGTTAYTFSAGIGCTTQPTTAGTNTAINTSTSAAAGIQSAVINAGGTGFEGGSTVNATFNGTCGTTPTGQTTVPGGGPPALSDQSLVPGTNILTNSGLGCTTQPGNSLVVLNAYITGSTLTPPGIASATLTTGFAGTGYNTADPPLVTVNGAGAHCSTLPTITPQINNSNGNITGFTVTNSGVCNTEIPSVLTLAALTIGAPGITNVNVTTAGTGYSQTNPPTVTIQAPSAPGGCSDSATTAVGEPDAQATGVAVVSAAGTITGVFITNPGCGYTSLTIPATIGGPPPKITITNAGTGYTSGLAPTFAIPAGFCTTGVNANNVAPVLGTAAISAVSGSTGGQVTGIPISNNASCTGDTPSQALTVSGNTPGIVSITPGNTGNSYNVAPRLTFNCGVTPPNVTVGLLGAAPTGVGSYTVNSYGANCTNGNITYTAPGLMSAPTAGQTLTPPVTGTAFTVTSPGNGYSTIPVVSVSGCTTTPAETAALTLPPATPGQLASVNLNSSTSGGDNCVSPTVALNGGTYPGFLGLDYLGGSGNDYGNGVSIDPNSNIYITGQTYSPDFPVLVSSTWTGSKAIKGPSDGFVSRITESGGTVQGNNGGGFSTYFGGSSNDSFNAIVVDNLLDVFVAGQTFSSDFPVTTGSAFSGDSDGTLTNLLFNNMVITPSTMWITSTPFDTPVNSPAYAINFANSSATSTLSIAGGPAGGAPGTTITYSANSGAVAWLTINTAPGGFTLTANPGTGATGLRPDNYTATFLISAPGSDTPPVTFTVQLSVTATFTTFNCTTPCTVGSTPSTSFSYTYTKAENTTPAGVASTLTQQLLVGLVGLPANSPTSAYPAPGTFTATVTSYNTNGAMISTGNTSTAATNSNFKWFTLAGADCSVVGGCIEPFGTNLAIMIQPAVLDTLWESSPGGGTTAQGTITFTQSNPGGGGITSTTITINATVTPRLVLTSADPTSLPGVGFAFSCTTGGSPNSPCTTTNNSSTSHIQLRGKDDVINIVSDGTANKMAVLTVNTTPPGGSAACFTISVPNGGYQAPASDDPTANDLSLPVQINIVSGGAACVQGVYTGTVSLSSSVLTGSDSILTTAGFTALTPSDSPAAVTTNVPVTITLGNELYLTNMTAFSFGNYVINSQEALSAHPGRQSGTERRYALVLPASQTGTVSLTLPPSTYSTNYAVTCAVAANGTSGYVPSTGNATNTGSTVTCDWLTASISSGTLSNGSTSATLTVGLTPPGGGGYNVTTLPTHGATPVNYTGTIVLTYTSGTLAGSSIAYPVSINVARQPLNWFTSVGGTPSTVNLTGTIGGGPSQSTLTAPCGSLYSTQTEYTASNPQALQLSLAALANQTFSTSTTIGASGAGPTSTGWLTVTQGAAGASGTPDGLTCTANITNLAPGTYYGCIDAVAVNNSGPVPTGVMVVPAYTSCAQAWPLFPTPGSVASAATLAASVGRTVETVVLTVTQAPQLISTPSGFNLTFQSGTGGSAGFQTGAGSCANTTTCGATLTLANNSSSSIQNVFATTSLPWLTISGPATNAGGVTVPGTSSTPVTLTVVPPTCATATCTYNGVISLACDSCTLLPATIPVQLTVNSTPSITTVPGTLTQFVYQQGGPTPATQNLVVNLTSGSGNVVMTPSCSSSPTGTCWLQVNGANTATASQAISTTGIQFSIGIDPTQFTSPSAASNTPYTGTVSIAIPGASNTPVTLNVSVLVIAQPTLNSTANNLSFTDTVGATSYLPNPTTSPSTVMVSTSTTSGQAASAGFTLTPTSQSNWLQINGASVAVSNTATITPLTYTITVSQAALTTLAASVPVGSSQQFTGSIAITTTTPPALAVNPTVLNYTLTISTIPAVNVSCPSTAFAYTLTNAATVPASISCTVSDSSSVVGINALTVTGCPGSWLTCTLGTTTLAAGGSTTMTLTPSNLANQNPGTFGAADQITVSGTIPSSAGGGAATSGSVSAVTIVNTPLITVSGATLGAGNLLTFPAYTQGNLQTPGNQTVTGLLLEGSGGAPAGPGTPGTGVLISAVSSMSFATGACTGGVTAPANWLAVTQAPVLAAGGGATSTSYMLSVAVNPAVFPTLSAATTCTGSVLVNSSGVTPAAAMVTLPVTFTINPQSGFTVTAESTTLTSGGTLPIGPTIVNGYPVSLTSTAAPVPVTVSSNPTQGQAYTVTIQPVTGGNWLTSTGCTVSNPCTAGTGGFSLGVAAAANTLAPGTYYATVSVASANSSSSPNNTVTFTVALTVDSTAVLSATQTGSLGGPYFPFFTTPGTLSLNVATASTSVGAPATPASFTVTQTALNGSTPSNLLIINGTQPYTTTGTSTTVPVTLTISAAVANTLGTTAPGIYGGTVTVTVTQTGVTTSPQTIAIPWSITIDAEAAIQTTPTAAQGVVINCMIGTTCTGSVAPYIIGVAATSTGLNVNIPVSTSVTSLPIPWLSVTSGPTTANSTSITLSANTAGLQANTSYAGQIVVTSADASNSPYTVPVTLNVLGTQCVFTPTGGTTINLTSAGTSTNGVLPEIPGTIGFSTTGTCGNYSATSNVPWLTATGGAGLTYVALSNPNSTPQTGTLTITNAGGTSSVTITVTEAANTAAEYPNREVTALYQSILGRDPDSGGYTYWTTSGLPLGTMADDFLAGPEAFNTDFAVMAAYQAATNAPPTYNQFLTAVSGIRAGGTLASLFNSLVATNPYSATTLYQYLLGRSPTAADYTACSCSALTGSALDLGSRPSSGTRRPRLRRSPPTTSSRAPEPSRT